MSGLIAVYATIGRGRRAKAYEGGRLIGYSELRGSHTHYYDAAASMDWPAMASIWAAGRDDTDEMMQGLLSIDATPEYARLSRHHTLNPLVRRIVTGLLANVIEKRIAWEEVQR